MSGEPVLEACAQCGHQTERGLACFYCLFGRDVVGDPSDAPLMAQIRELKEALRPFAAMYQGTCGADRIADTCPVSWHYDMYGTQALTTGDLRRAQRVMREADNVPA